MNTPYPTDSQFILDGKRYLLLEDTRGALALAIQRAPDQEADPGTPYSINVPDFSRGYGFSFEGPEGTYDEADGWDASAPGKAVTWPRLATGESIESTDARGWQLFLGGYLYVGRGRYVCKYEPSDEAGAEWPIIEIHDLGSGNVVGGRPAAFGGAGYWPLRAGAFGAAQRFHELTTIATHVTEVQTIAISGTPTGGTYTLTFDGKTTAGIAYNADAAAVQAALRAVAGLELVEVETLSGTTPNFTHQITLTGVGGSNAASSPPQLTSSVAGLTGGTPAIAHATTTPGTVDTWTQGPSSYEATAFVVWNRKLARANANNISLVEDDPMTGGDWGPDYPVGDSAQPITDLGRWENQLVVGKTNGLWTFDESTDAQPAIPDLIAIEDDANCLGMEAAQGYMLVPHKTGLIRWRPGAWRYVGADIEGGLEGERSGGWGRVQGIAPAGIYTFVAIANPYSSQSYLVSLAAEGGRQTQDLTPHMHQEFDDAVLEHAVVLSQATEPASPKSPATLADDNAVGSAEWDTPANAGASDDVRTTASGGTTHYLKATNFGFSIPAAATITGVRVTIERSASS